jgi:hypothetical protein
VGPLPRGVGCRRAPQRSLSRVPTRAVSPSRPSPPGKARSPGNRNGLPPADRRDRGRAHHRSLARR